MPQGEPMLQFFPPFTGKTGKYDSETGKVTYDIEAFLIVQPLKESYVAYDNWPEKGYANLIVNSCSYYDTIEVAKVIIEHMPGAKIQAEKSVEYTGEFPEKDTIDYTGLLLEDDHPPYHVRPPGKGD